MFLNSSLQVALVFANVASITVFTSKLVHNTGLKEFRERVFAFEKGKNCKNFNGKNFTTLLVFLQYSSHFFKV